MRKHGLRNSKYGRFSRGFWYEEFGAFLAFYVKLCSKLFSHIKTQKNYSYSSLSDILFGVPPGFYFKITFVQYIFKPSVSYCERCYYRKLGWWEHAFWPWGYYRKCSIITAKFVQTTFFSGCLIIRWKEILKSVKISNIKSALAKATHCMSVERKKILINSFFNVQFNYCPLKLMVHSCSNDNTVL